MRIAHLDCAGGADAVSMFQPDPVAVDELGEELSEHLETGLACRVIAVSQGECPCGAELLQLNRKMRRKTRAPFEAIVTHEYGCPAVSLTTRTWLHEHREMFQ